ncbi:hypothetical protein [Actinokineospora sp. NBRC 105648]|uniref:hypothetical protein n=1 Tax=Actinokineospora sp. NBRC 105648 TaxID=3032206 RepID=UPI0025541AB4|nr:hypothetical protein [Actinokineospora sp. NBRC 105648]
MTGPTERLPREDDATVELSRVRADKPERYRSGFWREFSGSLAVGLAVLALIVVGLQISGWVRGVPGPGVGVMVVHLVLAVIALLVQRFADIKRGPESTLAVLLVCVVTGIVIWFLWWA